MTTRTLTHPTPGPVTFDARTSAADIEVTVTDTTHATVTISTADTDGASHEAVADARMEHASGLLAVGVRDQGGITVVSRGNSVSISAVSIGRNVSIVGGRVFVDGAEVTAGSAPAPVTVRVVLPRGSRIQASTASGRITTSGGLDQADATTVSGSVSIEAADAATVTTTSGAIEIRRAQRAAVRTVSGATLVDRAAVASAHSVSGAVTFREVTGKSAAHTVSGDIAIWHAGPAPLTHTVTGRVHVTALHPAR